jgi:hypothetical protein
MPSVSNQKKLAAGSIKLKCLKKSTALSGYYNLSRLHIQYKYHFTKRREPVLWWTTPTSENASVPAALQRA